MAGLRLENPGFDPRSVCCNFAYGLSVLQRRIVTSGGFCASCTCNRLDPRDQGASHVRGRAAFQPVLHFFVNWECVLLTHYYNPKTNVIALCFEDCSIVI